MLRLRTLGLRLRLRLWVGPLSARCGEADSKRHRDPLPSVARSMALRPVPHLNDIAARAMEHYKAAIAPTLVG